MILKFALVTPDGNGRFDDLGLVALESAPSQSAAFGIASAAARQAAINLGIPVGYARADVLPQSGRWTAEFVIGLFGANGAPMTAAPAPAPLLKLTRLLLR